MLHTVPRFCTPYYAGGLRKQFVRELPEPLLTNRLREFLSQRGFVVQDVAEGANHAVTAQVAMAPGSPGMQRVEIQWIVSRRDGHELGRVLQLNEVRAGSLDRFWGDVAYVAAQEAAGGIPEIIRNATAAPVEPARPGG